MGARMTEPLLPNHNHPVVFRRQGGDRESRNLKQPHGMSDETFKRVRLMSCLIRNRQRMNENKAEFVTRLAKMVGLPAHEADAFLFGPLYRKDV